MAGKTDLIETIWVMDSEVCDCGALLDYFGGCPLCGWDGVDWDEEEDDLYSDTGDYNERAYFMGEYD